MRTVGAVAPEVVAAIGKGVQAGGYDKTGKFITASGAVVRGAIDGVSAYQSGEVNKYLTSAGAVVGAVAQYPFNPDAQMGLEAVGLISSTTGRAVAAFQQPPTEPFHTNYPLNTQIASYANASPASMSPATETSIGGSSGPEFVAPPLRRRTTRLDGQTTPAMTNMPLPEQRERARRGAPPLARTTSMQIPPADQNRSKGRKRSS
ncbi:hypothetical protein [Streptomyces sp. NPDC006645]|uniref:hypothetical protein n=1 Tax=unclassified Streptomyces TaxID=2593676 RepID=UPI0033A6EED7